MKSQRKGGAKAPPIPVGRLRTPESFAALLLELEPGWIQPPIENLEWVLSIAAAEKSRTKPRTVMHHKVPPITAALETLRRAAEANLGKFETVRSVVAALNLSDAGASAPREQDPTRRLEDLLAWFGERESAEIAFFDFGEAPLEAGEPSWRGKCRLFAAMLGPYWHPRDATHPVSESGSVVRALDVLLRLAGERRFSGGESRSSGGYTLRALVNFLGAERKLLGHP